MTSPAMPAALGGHSAEHQQLVFWVAAVVFVAVVFGLLVLYRRSRDGVEMEAIDALLRDEDIL
jgi:hypothetical protein